MKNLIVTFVFVFALICSFTASAIESDKGNKKSASFGTGIYTTQKGKINVLVDKYDFNSVTHLLIKNHNGAIIYRETINKHQLKFGRALNLRDLQAGSYSIEVISNGERHIQHFELAERISHRDVKLEF